MIDRRIRIAKDKINFLKKLLNIDEGKGPFNLQVDVLAFAATLGANGNRREPLGDTTKEPIRQEVFDRQGYDTLINLLAIYNTNEPDILADNDEKIDQRATIFEEYANGGLAMMREQFHGAVDYLNEILLLIAEQRKKLEGGEEEFDLGKILE